METPFTLLEYYHSIVSVDQKLIDIEIGKRINEKYPLIKETVSPEHKIYTILREDIDEYSVEVFTSHDLNKLINNLKKGYIMNTISDRGYHSLDDIIEEELFEILRKKDIPIVGDDPEEELTLDIINKYIELYLKFLKDKLIKEKKLEAGIYHYTLNEF